MKRIYFFTILSLLYIQAFSQNWIPVNPAYKYNYRHDTAQYITNTIYVDSIKVINGDSVYYLNRIMSDCDTCTSLPWGPYIYNLKNQPQFLQRKMIKLDNETWQFDDTLTFYLKPKSELGETWVFDSSQNVFAQITKKYLGNIFSLQDSMKRITLSNGKYIFISKHYGITRFSLGGGHYVTLEGIEGLDLGIQISKFYEYFNFQVEDVHQYHYMLQWIVGWEPIYYRTNEKITILDKYVYPDSIIYYTHSLGYSWYETHFGMPYDTSYFNIYTELKFYDSSGHICNKYNLELAKNPMGQYEIGIPYAGMVLLDRESDTIIIKKVGHSEYEPALYTYANLTNPSAHPDLLEECCVNGFIMYYKTKLGETYFYFFDFEISGSRELIGYVKNGDTVGTVIDDSLLTVVHDKNMVISSFSIYPNPADDYFYLEYNHPMHEKTQLDIYDVNGIKQKSIIMETQTAVHQINISFLNPGVYILLVRNSQFFNYKKMIVK